MDVEKYNDSAEIQHLIQLMLSQQKSNSLDIEIVRRIMDNVWDNMECDNQNLDWDKINAYYNHPIWLLNGLFKEQHEPSMRHRYAISDWIVEHNLKNIVDYGGGIGTLARLIASKDTSSVVDIFEPHPTEYAISKTASYPNVHFVNQINKKYDCLISTDVLEHVPDPLKLFSEMIEAVNIGGYLIIANNFYPVIKCHLPSTFHFRHTFKRFAQPMGLRLIGSCEGTHANIYVKRSDSSFNWSKIRKYERISRIMFPILETASFSVSTLKSRV